jgi:hypothetical protein
MPSFGPRLRCEPCGRLGANTRPNWQGTGARYLVWSGVSPFIDAGLGASQLVGDSPNLVGELLMAFCEHLISDQVTRAWPIICFVGIQPVILDRDKHANVDTAR